MIKFQFQPGPGAKNQSKRKPRHESREIILNQKLGPILDWKILVEL